MIVMRVGGRAGGEDKQERRESAYKIVNALVGSGYYGITQEGIYPVLGEVLRNH